MRRLNKEEKFLKKFINKQFEIAGHDMTYDGLKDRGLFGDQENEEDNWYNVYTCDEYQQNKIKKWFLSEYARCFSVNKNKGQDSATNTWPYFAYTWGLSRNDYDAYEEVEEDID